MKTMWVTGKHRMPIHHSSSKLTASRRKILCCTWGSSGATAVRKPIPSVDSRDQEWAEAPAWHPDDASAQPVDTIGAGDTFIAGMLYGLVQFPNSTLQKRLEYANELAGRKVFQHGFVDLGLKMEGAVE